MDDLKRAAFSCPEPISECCGAPFENNVCSACGVQSVAVLSAWIHAQHYRVFYDPETRHVIDIQSDEEPE